MPSLAGFSAHALSNFFFGGGGKVGKGGCGGGGKSTLERNKTKISCAPGVLTRRRRARAVPKDAHSHLEAMRSEHTSSLRKKTGKEWSAHLSGAIYGYECAGRTQATRPILSSTAVLCSAAPERRIETSIVSPRVKKSNVVSLLRSLLRCSY